MAPELVAYMFYGNSYHPLREDGRTYCGREPYGLLSLEEATGPRRNLVYCARCEVYRMMQARQGASS